MSPNDKVGSFLPGTDYHPGPVHSSTNPDFSTAQNGDRVTTHSFEWCSHSATSMCAPSVSFGKTGSHYCYGFTCIHQGYSVDAFDGSRN